MPVDIKVGRLRLVNAQSLQEKLSAIQALYEAAREQAVNLGNDLDRTRNDLQYERTIGHQKYFADRYRNLFVYMADTQIARDRLSKLVSMVPPHQAEGVQKIRLGRPNDGGYVFLDDFDVPAALSLGISDDVSWDLDVAERGLNIYQFDHTVDGPPVPHPRFTFYKKRIGTISDGGITLGEACRMADITEPASAILKIDIEHAEWPVFAATSDEDLSKFSQIVGEFHGFDEVLNDEMYENALQALTNISRQFRLVHVHGNNYGSQMVLGSKLFPRTLEMTFANISRYKLSPSNESFPTPLDMPNCPDKPDHILDNFAL